MRHYMFCRLQCRGAYQRHLGAWLAVSSYICSTAFVLMVFRTAMLPHAHICCRYHHLAGTNEQLASQLKEAHEALYDVQAAVQATPPAKRQQQRQLMERVADAEQVRAFCCCCFLYQWGGGENPSGSLPQHERAQLPGAGGVC